MIAIIRFKDGTERKYTRVRSMCYWDDGCRGHEYPVIYVLRETKKDPELIFNLHEILTASVREAVE